MKSTLVCSLSVLALVVTGCSKSEPTAPSAPKLPDGKAVTLPAVPASVPTASVEQAKQALAGLTTTVSTLQTQYTSLKPLVEPLASLNPTLSSKLKSAETSLAKANESVNLLKSLQDDPSALLAKIPSVQQEVTAAQQAVAAIAAAAPKK